MQKILKTISRIYFFIIGIIFLILSLYSTINYAGTAIGQILGYLISAAFITAGAIQNVMIKYLKKPGFLIMTVIFIFSFIFTATFSIFSVSVLHKKDAEEKLPELYENSFGTIISLGTEVRGKAPSLMLSKRLNSTILMMKKYPNMNCIVSGGVGEGKQYSEAEVMKEYLIKNGIDEKRVFTEDQSHNTKQNITNSKNIIYKYNLDSENVFISTSNFHLFRAKLIARRNGLSPKAEIVSKIPDEHLFPNLVREYFAIIKTVFLDF